jgi:hypothetical protein
MTADVAARFQSLAHLTRRVRQLGLRAVTPDLSAWQRVVIEQDDARTAGRRSERSGHAGGTGTDDQQVGVFAHA